MFEDDVFIRVLELAPKNAGRNLNTDLVLCRSRGSPGHWFPETDYLCASAIFDVGTSDIPPNLNYRSVSPMALLVGFGVFQHTMRKTSFKTRQTRNI